MPIVIPSLGEQGLLSTHVPMYFSQLSFSFHQVKKLYTAGAMNRRIFVQFGKLILAFLLFFSIFLLVTREESREKHRPTPAARPEPATPRGFCVFDQKCRIPRVDPFAPDVMQVFRVPEIKQCTDQADIFSIRYDRSQKLYVLHMNKSSARAQMPNVSEFGCAYNEIIRGESDSMTWAAGPNRFSQDWVIPRHIQGIIVECWDAENRSRIVQRDAFSFAQYPTERSEWRDEQLSRSAPSVFMLGIDSMSHANFQRTMPRTARFVQQLGWHELLGYTKVGDNSLPNMLGLLTGLSSREWRARCDVAMPGCFDRFTYLWDHFQRAGYLTAYAEDTPSIDTFHYLSHGFIRQPVDYYLRTLINVLEILLDTVQHFGFRYCLGRRQTFRYVLDYCLQLVERFVEETPKPLFGLFWLNSFSHDDFQGPASVDADFVGYLERFQEHGLFDRAIVVLLSDHGQRQGPLMQLSSSFLEERLPMLHIYLPPWYRHKYPERARALAVNRHRLSSTLDLHLTLGQLAQEAQPGVQLNSSCAKCQSLLESIPRNRSCQDAGIPEHWCACEPYEQLQVDVTLRYWAKVIVYRINSYLSRLSYEQKCLRLGLARLVQGERKLSFDSAGKPLLTPTRAGTYRIEFVTNPNSGVFRATFRLDAQRGLQLQEEFITRLNSYRNESFCVKERVAKKFCVCTEARSSPRSPINIDAN